MMQKIITTQFNYPVACYLDDNYRENFFKSQKNSVLPDNSRTDEEFNDWDADIGLNMLLEEEDDI
jgi:hypothetical protein